MAKLKIMGGDELAAQLDQLGKSSDKTARRAVMAGAGILADQVRENLKNLKEAVEANHKSKPYHFLNPGEKFSGIPEYQKKDLLDALGISPVDIDDHGDYNAKVGFDGYGSQPTAKYPKGLPNPLAARATESGSSVRPKQPFIRPAVRKTKDAVIEAMQSVIDEEIKKTEKR